MPMQFLSATTDANGIHYTIWLDITQGTQEVPDPAYVRSYDWAPAPNDWEGGEAAYQQMTLDEVKLLAQADLDTINASLSPTQQPTPMSVQGQTF